MQLASKKIVSGKSRNLFDADIWLMLLIRNIRAIDSLANYRRIRYGFDRGLSSESICFASVSIFDLDLDPRALARSDSLLRRAGRRRCAAYVRVRNGQVRQPTGSLDHMSETNDAHVTRWRHGSRGIAVLSADCSPNTSAAQSLSFSIQMIYLRSSSIPYLRRIQRSMANGVLLISFIFLLNLLNHKTSINFILILLPWKMFKNVSYESFTQKY